MDLETVAQALSRIPVAQRRRLSRSLRERAFAKGLRIGEKPIDFQLVPLWQPRDKLEQAAASLNQFAEHLFALELQALANPLLRERLTDSLHPGGKWCASLSDVESEAKMRRRLRRIDGYWTGEGFRLIEVNQAAPLALHFHDTAGEAAEELMERAGIEMSWSPLAPRLLEWFLLELKEHSPEKELRHIAVVLEQGYPAKFTDLPGMAARLKRQAKTVGIDLELSCCLPHEVKLCKQVVVVNHRPVDLIWRNSVYLETSRRLKLDTSDYEKVLADQSQYLVCNSTRAWLTLSKEALAILWQSGVRGCLPETLPWQTRPNQLDPSRDWVSKPCDASFGQGVRFRSGSPDWEHVCQQRMAPGWVYQERVRPSPQRVLDLDNEGCLVWQDREVDFCPYQVAGSWTGSALQRSLPLEGREKTMNLVGGAKLLPLGFAATELCKARDSL